MDGNSIFRVGSITKLFSVYLWLVEVGDVHWKQPITDFVPELKAAGNADDVERVQWEDVTIEALASHMSGIGRGCG